MSLSWEREASESLVQSRHDRGPLLSYLLAPRTGNLCFEEVVTRVLQENWETHERVKERFRSTLNSSCCQCARLTQELDELSQGIEAASDRKLCKQTEERMGILQTTLKKVETSIAESEDHLKESQKRKEEAHQKTGASLTLARNKMEMFWWKEPREVAPQVRRPLALSEVKKQSPLWRWMWVTSHHLPPRMQQLSHLRRMRCSRAIPPQWLERWPIYRSPLLKAISPRMAKPRNRSRPPLCVNEVLHMSPLHSLRGRKKKEEGRP